MAAYEVLLLNTAIPQIQAAQSGDTYVVPRDIAFSTVANLANGTYLLPSLTFSSDPDTGIFRQGANALGFTAGGGSDQMVLTSTGLGIGTSSPGAKLHVASSAAGSYGAIIYNTSATGQGLTVRGGSTSSQDAFNVQTYDGSTSLLSVQGGGNVGIGASSPAVKLEVVAPAGDNIVSTFRSGDATAANNAGGGFRSISSATATSRLAQVWLDADGANLSGGDYFYIQKNGNSGTADIVQYSNAAMTFSTNATERARITSGGDLQITNGGSMQVGGAAARATTAGTNRLDIFDGTAPVGTLANGVSFYSTAGEARVMDAAGNATLLSPHDAETNEWIFHSKHTPTGKVLKIDVERLLKFVNDHFGLDAVHEFVEK